MPQLVKLISVNIVYLVNKKCESFVQLYIKQRAFWIMFTLMYGAPRRMSHWEERGGLSPLLITTR